MQFLENIIANLWNRLVLASKPKLKGGLKLGTLVVDGRPSKKPYFLPQTRRSEHLVTLGKTGSGKSFLLRHLCLCDIKAGRGFLYFDHHGDAIPFLLSAMAAEERQTGKDFASRLVVLEPGNLEWAVGLNPMAVQGEQQTFIQIVAVTAILKERWGLEHFGARTEELLRNSLFVLAANRLTLVEFPALLSNQAFRIQCLKKVSNTDVREYFESRFEPMSDAMKAVMRDPILNKLSEFISDPHFKYILGQTESTFSFDDVLNKNQIVLVDLSKGKLGRHSSTLGTLILSHVRPAIFSRKSRELFTVYADEVQNLLTADTDFDVYFSEARKFAVSITTANQFLDQFPKRMRAAIQAIGTHILFQLSPPDAQEIAGALDGGKPLAELLKNLPQREFVVRSGSYGWKHVQAPRVETLPTDFSGLLKRSRQLYARPRLEVEEQILARRPQAESTKEVLDAWE